MSNPPQTEPLDEKQIKNSAGGYSYAVTDWVRLDRFLILGTESGSYYATEHKLTKANSDAALRCIKEDGVRVVNRVVEISQAGRAPKNDPALFVLALCAADKNETVRATALQALPKVARIGTHLFKFAEYVNGLRGWGRGLRKAVANWYLDKDLKELQNQLVKYQQRDGWGHSDLLRLAHPMAKDVAVDTSFRWALGTPTDSREVHKYPKGQKDAAKTFKYEQAARLPSLIAAFEEAKKAHTKRVIALIREHGMTREMVPTETLTKPEVWEALLEKMPMTAMIRNLANMTRVGLLAPMSEASKTIASRLHDLNALRKARIHPVQALIALLTYSAGHGARSRGEGWTPVQQVVGALDSAFYLSFGNVEPTGKRWYLGVDVSGSMGGGEIAGCPGLTPRIGAAAMSMVTARVEEDYLIKGFSHQLVDLWISPRQRLDDVVKIMNDRDFGGTDCALPILDAQKTKTKFDVFCIITDGETWAGDTHTMKALRDYRKAFVPNAKLICVNMVSNELTVGDPDDAGVLNCIGFDTATPNLLSDFARE
jgi:60 kDa SS-A/Ro ribonucleoprotein